MSESLKDATERKVDTIAGAGTSDQAEGAAKETVGRGKQTVGAATNDDSLRAEGAKDEIAGKAQGAWGEVKEGAQKVGERIKDALD